MTAKSTMYVIGACLPGALIGGFIANFIAPFGVTILAQVLCRKPE